MGRSSGFPGYTQKRCSITISPMKQSRAPWTKVQVQRLLVRQLDSAKHPYTCLNGHTLYPSENGLVCPTCKYTQAWCYAVDVEHPDEDEIRDRIAELEMFLSGAQSLEEAKHIQKLIYELEDRLENLE